MDLEAATMKAGRPVRRLRISGHNKMVPWTMIPIAARLREMNG